MYTYVCIKAHIHTKQCQTFLHADMTFGNFIGVVKTTFVGGTKSDGSEKS